MIAAEMTVATASKRAMPAMKDQLGGIHDDSHAGIESFQYASKVPHPNKETKVLMNSEPSVSGTSRMPIF
jgi:hypothetical protein